MTEPRASRPPLAVPPVRRTVTAGIAVFLAVLALLAWQVRTGRDPALARAASRPVVVTSTPRRVLVRKVIRRIVIERVVHDDGVVTQQPVVATIVTHVPATSGGTSSAAPSRSSAPAATPAPAPAPQPAAPLVTRSS